MKRKIINILSMPPAYHFYKDKPRPQINWDTGCGQWVGIWGYDWPNQLGDAVLRLSDEFEYEVWQPDTRADKIYTYVFKNGLTHKLFPAVVKKGLYGAKLVSRIFSNRLIEEFEKMPKASFIIHLMGSLTDIVSRLNGQRAVFTFQGDINLPSTARFSPTKNILSKINHFTGHRWVKKNINRIGYITYSNDKNLTHLKMVYKNRMQKLTMGCDFNYYKKLDKAASREQLGLARDKFVMLSASNLIDLKQVDKFIKALIEIMDKYNFLYVVAGHGEERYQKYLQHLARPLMERGKIFFAGYLNTDTLLKYLNGADLFVLTSASEGASVAVMQALACQLPVFSTRAGNTAEVLEQNGAGCIVGTKDYKQWRDSLSGILSKGIIPRPLDIKTAAAHYDWQNVAQRFIDIYRDVANSGKNYNRQFTNYPGLPI